MNAIEEHYKDAVLDARSAVYDRPLFPKECLERDIAARLKNATKITIHKMIVQSAGYKTEEEFTDEQVRRGRGVQITKYEYMIWRDGSAMDAWYAGCPMINWKLALYQAVSIITLLCASPFMAAGFLFKFAIAAFYFGINAADDFIKKRRSK